MVEKAALLVAGNGGTALQSLADPVHCLKIETAAAVGVLRHVVGLLLRTVRCSPGSGATGKDASSLVLCLAVAPPLASSSASEAAEGDEEEDDCADDDKGNDADDDTSNLSAR